MKLIDKIRKETPLKDKIDGIFCTKIGVMCTAVLATGLIVNPVGIIALTIGAVVFSGKAIYHAQKTK
jgi:hypothetical protein